MVNESLTMDRVDLQFAFEPKKESSCPLYLANNTDNFVTFQVTATAQQKYLITPPDIGVVLPRSTAAVLVTMKAQTEAPADMQCEDIFWIRYVVASPGATAKEFTTDMFSKIGGYQIEETKLRVRYVAKLMGTSISDHENDSLVDVQEDSWTEMFSYYNQRPRGEKLRRAFNVPFVPMAVPSICSCEFTPPPQYKVFINFRGDELRANFVSFLVKAMRSEKINVFIDEYEERGTNLNNLFHTIEECRISVAIFSERYTQSCWCLDELVKMVEQMEKGNLVVIPVFFKLEATTCKRLLGTFGDNFRKLEWEYRSESEIERVDKWKKALSSVSNYHGFESNIRSDESKLVDSIVEEVKKLLNKISIGGKNAKNSTIVV